VSGAATRGEVLAEQAHAQQREAGGLGHLDRGDEPLDLEGAIGAGRRGAGPAAGGVTGQEKLPMIVDSSQYSAPLAFRLSVASGAPSRGTGFSNAP
jgi:hypothetical protein